MSSGPIYIGGVSYSGKTQLRLMLSKHPNIIITRRTYLWRTIYNQFGDLSNKENFDRCLSEILSLKPIQKLQPERNLISSEFWQGDPSYTRLFSIIHQQYAKGLGKSRWGIQIKMIESETDMILTEEPDARIIQVIRNPVDRTEESLSKGSRKMAFVGWEASRWKASSFFGLKNLEKYPNHYLIVKWEDLLKDVERTLETVFQFLGEENYPINLNQQDLDKMGLEENKQYAPHQKLTPKKAIPDHKKLSATEKKFVEIYSEPESTYFEYNSSKTRLSMIDLLKYLIFVYPANFFGAQMWKLKNS